MTSILNKKNFSYQASCNYTAKFFKKKSSVCILINGSLKCWLPTNIHEYLYKISSDPLRLLSLLEIINQLHSNYHVRIDDLYNILRISKKNFNESMFELLTMDSEFVIEKILETQEFLGSIKTSRDEFFKIRPYNANRHQLPDIYYTIYIFELFRNIAEVRLNSSLCFDLLIRNINERYEGNMNDYTDSSNEEIYASEK